MEEKKYLQLNDINTYKISFYLSNFVWEVVLQWDYFARDTISKQFVRSIDSSSANIAEGFGRHGKKDKVKFYRYARGSVYESLDWLEKARVRKLITKKQYDYIFKTLKSLPKEINSLISYINSKLTI